MTEAKTHAGVFRGWCEGWDGRLNGLLVQGHPAPRRVHTRGEWAVQCSAGLPGTSAGPSAEQVQEFLSIAGISDDIYLSGLLAFESGLLGYGERRILSSVALLRVFSVWDRWRPYLPDTASQWSSFKQWGTIVQVVWGALEAYWNDKHSIFCHKKSNTKVRQAALALADAIEESGCTDQILVMDRLVWYWALGPELSQEHTDAIERMRQIEFTATSTQLNLEAYLRGLAEYLKFKSNNPDIEGIGIDNKQGSALRPYILRIVRTMLTHAFPEHTRTPHGMNVLTAEICAAILAQEIKPNDVANVIKGSGIPRAYCIE